MRTHTSSPRSVGRGFTLVELLVVIGIIAVLISILLPSLNKARRASKAVQCASNMKQLGMALLQYTNDNKGRMIPAQILRNPTSPQTIYPDGFGWSNELVHQKYLPGPNNLDAAGKVVFDKPSPFQCPEGIAPDDQTGGGSTSAEPMWPTNIANNSWTMVKSNVPRKDGQVVYGTATWYQINARTQTSAQNDPGASGSQRVSPYMDFTSAATNADVTAKKFARNLSMVKKPHVMVMIVEGTDPNWVDQTATVEPNGRTFFIRRIGARHGQKTADGYNAFMNVCFFDGHVDLQATDTWVYQDPINFGEGSGHVIYLNKQ